MLEFLVIAGLSVFLMSLHLLAARASTVVVDGEWMDRGKLDKLLRKAVRGAPVRYQLRLDGPPPLDATVPVNLLQLVIELRSAVDDGVELPRMDTADPPLWWSHVPDEVREPLPDRAFACEGGQVTTRLRLGSAETLKRQMKEAVGDAAAISAVAPRIAQAFPAAVRSLAQTSGRLAVRLDAWALIEAWDELLACAQDEEALALHEVFWADLDARVRERAPAQVREALLQRQLDSERPQVVRRALTALGRRPEDEAGGLLLVEDGGSGDLSMAEDAGAVSLSDDS